MGASRGRSFCARGLRVTKGEVKMTHQDIYQQGSWQNPNQSQWGGNSQYMPQYMPGLGIGQGVGQAAYGFQSGPHGAAQFGGGWGQQSPWQRQLSPQDVGEVVRQMVPLL